VARLWKEDDEDSNASPTMGPRLRRVTVRGGVATWVTEQSSDRRQTDRLEAVHLEEKT
jgi:hypothetical protein